MAMNIFVAIMAIIAGVVGVVAWWNENHGTDQKNENDNENKGE